MNKYIITPIAFILFIVSRAVFAWGIVFDPTNYAQNALTAYQTGQSLFNQVTQMTRQWTMLQNQIKNISQLNFQTWDNAQQALLELGNTAKMANGSLTYSTNNVDSQFKQVFPGYSASSGSDTTDYSKSFQKWNQANNATQRGTMDQMQESYKQLNNEQQTDSKLASKASSSVGQMQAQQVGNEIGAEQLAQTQKLRATMMAQTSSQAAYYSYQSQKDATKQKSVDQITKNADSKYPQYKDVSEFGLIPEFHK